MLVRSELAFFEFAEVEFWSFGGLGRDYCRYGWHLWWVAVIVAILIGSLGIHLQHQSSIQVSWPYETRIQPVERI